jgi:hypothetical protein
MMQLDKMTPWPSQVMVLRSLVIYLKLGQVDVLEAALIFLSEESHVCTGSELVAATGHPKCHLSHPIDGSCEGQDVFILQLSEVGLE